MQTGGGSEAILLLNMQTIGIRNEQTVKAIAALARRKELGGPGGILWKILSSQYRPTLLKRTNRVITFFGRSIIRRNLKTHTTGH